MTIDRPASMVHTFMADMPTLPDIAIVGGGKVGTAVGILAVRAGLHVVAVGGRNADTTRAAAGRIGPGVRACPVDEAAGAGGLVLLTVPDDAIETVCRDLAEVNAFADGAVVAHCSGALSSDVLSPAQDACGCAVGSMHPLQTFPTAESALARLPGAYCFCEGDSRAVEMLEELARAIGATPARIDVGAKALYHAAAVTACNYLTTLLDAAVAMCAKAGIDRETALAALGPLSKATLENVAAMGPEGALTGPIARGDAGTVRRHLEALGGCDEKLEALYRTAGLWTADLAERKGTLDRVAATALTDLLRNERN